MKIRTKPTMPLPLNAKKRKQPKTVLVWWHFLVFFLLLMVVILLLFPKIRTLRVLEESKPNAISLAYLKNMVAKYPNDPSYKIMLASQEVSLGNMNAAQKLIAPYYVSQPKSKDEWQAMWVKYVILRTEAYRLAERNPVRKHKEAELRTIVGTLAKSPYLTWDKMSSLADDAVALDETTLSVQLYQKVAQLNKSLPPQYYAKAAEVALYVSEYQSSSELYFLAMNRADTLDKKRDYFFKALDALKSGNLLDLALEKAKQHMSGLEQDEPTILYLSKLALMANKPNIALEYTQRSLQLRYRSD